LRQRAEDLTARLADVAPPPVLLHGDLGPYNVVVSPRGPVFIDPIGSRGLPAWDLARLAAAWEALGRSRILAPLLAGYGERPPFLAETLAWTALVYLKKNLPFPETPLRPHLLPLLDELYSAETPQRFLTYFLKD
jgi:Ser/Thr protein kinase RdoA (MazF antagonist)